MVKIETAFTCLFVVIAYFSAPVLAAQEKAPDLEKLSKLAYEKPQDKKLWLDLAQAYLAAGDAEKACEAADMVQALDPGDISAIRLSEKLAFQAKRFQEARILARRLIALEPDNADNYLPLEVLADQESTGTGEAEWLLRLARQSGKADVLCEIGNNFFEQGQAAQNSGSLKNAKSRWWQLANDAFTSAVALKPDMVSANIGLAKLYLAEGRGADAYEMAQEALKAQPADKSAQEMAKKAEAAKDDLLLSIKTWLSQFCSPS